MQLSCTFNRLLHWIELTENSTCRCLMQYDLRNMSGPDVIRRGMQGFQTLAENIQQNCIYTARRQNRCIIIQSLSVQGDDSSCAQGLSFNPQGQFISINFV